MALTKTSTTSTTSFSTTQDMAEHPNPIPNPHHRKIDLQSHGDLTYLQQNLALAAREKLDLYFPPQQAQTTKSQPKSAPPATIISLDGAPKVQDPSTQQSESENQPDPEPEIDPLRSPVTSLIDSFLLQTYTSASQNITVNGIDASSLPQTTPFPNASNPSPSTNPDTTTVPLDPSQEIEGIHYVYAPFDRKLQKQMQALYEEVEALTSQVATLRRETPKAAAERYNSALEGAITAEEESWQEEQRRVQEKKEAGLTFNGVRDGWNEDVKGVYERGVGDLAVLSGVMGGNNQGRVGQRSGGASLTETVGKAERARAVAGEFE